MGVAGLLLTVVGVVPTLVVLDGRKALVAAIIVVAAMPWLLALIPKIRRWPLRAAALAAGFTAVMLTVAAVVAYDGATHEPPPEPVPTTPPRIAATINVPADDGVVRSVPVCLTVRGTATLPAGMTLVVAAKQARDTRYYFESDLTWDGDRWSASVSLSRDDPRDAGSTFTIVAVAMDQRWARYLAATSPTPGDTWWSNPDLPPGAVPAEQLDVIRSADTTGC